MPAAKSSTGSFSIAVVGGGIAGLTLAVALLSRNIKVTIYEQASNFGEIGAGVAFGPNAVRAMRKCDERISKAFEKVATRNQWPSKSQVYFDWVDGYHYDGKTSDEKHLFHLEVEGGFNAVHRAHFLDELVKLVPSGISEFGKRLENIQEKHDGRLELEFADGSSAVADAVVGCDGVKSRVRQLVLGEDSEASYPHYTHKYAYRGLIPMDKAIEVLSEGTAVNAKMHMGYEGHVLTFPVAGGKTMNVVAFKTNPEPWPNPRRLTLTAKKTDALHDFQEFGPKVQAIINMLEDDLDCWAIFDTMDYPPHTYYKGRMLLSGDAAHATSPHHGSGAGFCCEDSACLSELLAEVSSMVDSGNVEMKEGLEAAFAAFDESRKGRAQWLVESSRRVGDLFEWRAEGVGSNIDKIREELVQRHDIVWNGDIESMIDEAKNALAIRTQGRIEALSGKSGGIQERPVEALHELQFTKCAENGQPQPQS